MDEFQMCVAPGCHTPAVKQQYWSRSRAPFNTYTKHPSDMCTTHHRERIAGDVVRCQVTNEYRIVDILTGESVAAPGFVDLDPAHTFMPGLIREGLIKVVVPEPVTKTAKPAKDTTPAPKGE